MLARRDRRCYAAAIREGTIMKRFRRGAAIVIAVLFFIHFTAFAAIAQELKTASEIIAFSSSKIAAYKTWSADYTQNLGLPGGAITINARMIEKLPRKMWLQLDMPMVGQKGKMTMVLGDDGILWRIMETGTQPQIVKLDVTRILSNAANLAGGKFDPLDRVDPTRRWEATKDLYDFQMVNPQPADGQSVYVMEGLLKASAVTNQQVAAEVSRVGKVRVSIGQGDGFLRRLEQYDQTSTNLIMAMEFKNLKLNLDVPDATFVYRPPADAQVTDTTPMMEMQLRAHEGESTPGMPGSTPPAPSAPRPK
jgi:outer membrane lipoprotein-sorting protein